MGTVDVLAVIITLGLWGIYETLKSIELKIVYINKINKREKD
jgi:hypothetical protein